MEEETKTIERRGRRRLRRLLLPLCLIAAGALALALWGLRGGEEAPPEVMTISTLERIVDVSELATFTAVYNGVAQVQSEEKPQEASYYVSYEAKVNAGLDFQAVAFDLDAESKVIRAVLPPVHITKVNVDITSLDYIFLDKKKNASSVSQEAYRACERDAKQESGAEQAIFTLARQNAENILRALITPFVEQLDEGYALEITWEGEKG